MIDLKRFGYKSRAAFLRDENPSIETIYLMSGSLDWRIQKSVLLHKKCPIETREMFANNPVWYKRFVALFSNNAPEGFWKKAENDINANVRNAFKRLSMPLLKHG